MKRKNGKYWNKDRLIFRLESLNSKEKFKEKTFEIKNHQ
jgi:hypothetical protein